MGALAVSLAGISGRSRDGLTLPIVILLTGPSTFRIADPFL
jgi:hypothetical protein